jgi:hypothetical protein
MSFHNACFVSYRNSKHPSASKILSALIDALSAQIDLYMSGSTVYVDRQRLAGGDLYDPLLAMELCRSSCMVLVFNPSYFDVSHPFCTREYLAMEKLEKTRLESVQQIAHKGLIIPLILRSGDSLPGMIERRSPVYFDRDLLRPADFNTRQALLKLKAVAQQVFERCRIMHSVEAAAGAECGAFQLPSDEEAKSWLAEASLIRPQASLPF